MVEILKPSQQKILEALARYKFLTSSQMIRLGISKRRSNLSVMLKPLKETKRAFIGEMQFAFIPTKGRLENFYYLKNKGKRILLDSGMEETEIRIPKGRTVMFTQDYFHRKYTIDCHIACDLSAVQHGVKVLFFDRYFDKTGNNRISKNLQAKTKVATDLDYIIADGSLLIESEHGSKLYALELYNDKNTKRILRQLDKHLEGIKSATLCRNYGIEKAHRLLAIFTHSETKKAVMAKFEDKRLGKYVFFNDYERVVEDFFEGWGNETRQTNIKQ